MSQNLSPLRRAQEQLANLNARFPDGGPPGHHARLPTAQSHQGGPQNGSLSALPLKPHILDPSVPTTLRRDLETVRRQVQLERERRLAVEQLVSSEAVEAVPSEHAEAVARRDMELSAVRAEKEAMLEWLRRGVAEAERITLQAEELKPAVDAATGTRADLQTELSRMRDLEERLSAETDATKAKLGRLKEARDGLSEHTEHTKSVLDVTRDIAATTAVETEKLKEEHSRLQEQRSVVEAVEQSSRRAAVEVRRFAEGIRELNAAMAEGAPAVVALPMDPADGIDGDDGGCWLPGSNSGTGGGIPGADPDLPAAAARVLRSESLLHALREALRRGDSDYEARKAALQAAQSAAAEAHRQAITDACEAHAQAVATVTAQRDEQRRFLEMASAQKAALDAKLAAIGGSIRSAEVAASAEHNTFAGTMGGPGRVGSGSPAGSPTSGHPAGHARGPPSGIDVVAYFKKDIVALGKAILKAEAENKALAEQNDERRADYLALREMRREYRDLEVTKADRQSAVRAGTVLKRDLKLAVREQQSASMEEMAASQPPKPWRGPVMY